MVHLRDVERHRDDEQGDGHVVLEYNGRAYAVCFDGDGPYKDRGYYYHDWDGDYQYPTIVESVDYHPHPTVWIENGELYV